MLLSTQFVRGLEGLASTSRSVAPAVLATCPSYVNYTTSSKA